MLDQRVTLMRDSSLMLALVATTLKKMLGLSQDITTGSRSTLVGLEVALIRSRKSPKTSSVLLWPWSLRFSRIPPSKLSLSRLLSLTTKSSRMSLDLSSSTKIGGPRWTNLPSCFSTARKWASSSTRALPQPGLRPKEMFAPLSRTVQSSLLRS